MERVEEEGNGTLAPSSYFPRSASILNLSVCLCVCVCIRIMLADVIDLSSMISSPCFLSFFLFFFLSIIVTFTSLSILIDNN